MNSILNFSNSNCNNENEIFKYNYASFVKNNNNLNIELPLPVIDLPLPKCWYPLERSLEDGKIRVNFPLGLKLADRKIYFFRDITSNNFLVGKTASPGRKRFYRYMSEINNEGSSEFDRDVNERPHAFKLGIVQFKEGIDLSTLEDDYIEALKKTASIYNKRRGGGGGEAKMDGIQKPVYIPMNLGEVTPEKRYPINSKPSPTFYEKIKSNERFIYSLMHVLKLHEYVGKTYLADPSVRSNQHYYLALREIHEKGVHAAIANSPKKISFGLLPVFEEPAEGLMEVESLEVAERLYIEAKTERAKKRYSQILNLSPGGEGPVGRKRLRKKLFKDQPDL